MQVNEFTGVKNLKIDFMSKVMDIYPRGNRVYIYGIFSWHVPSSSSSGRKKNFFDDYTNKNGMQVLVLCDIDSEKGIQNCDSLLSMHDTSIYLGFDNAGNHLDVYTDSLGEIKARNYKFDMNPYQPDTGKATRNYNTVLAYTNYVFDTMAINTLLKTNYIWNFDVTASGLRIRFFDNEKHSFTCDQINYRRGAGNGPAGKESVGYQTKNWSEVQRNWVYSMTTKQITRMNNLPTYLKVDPQTFTSGKIDFTATEGKNSAKIEVNFDAITDPLAVKPVLPELPDYRISENTVSTYKIPRSAIQGNALKYSATFDGPKQYTPLIKSGHTYLWTLKNPTPVNWTPYFSYGNNQLALIHEEKGVYTLTYYFCPPLGIPNTNSCFGIVSTKLTQAPTEEMPYLLKKPIALTGARDYFIIRESVDSYKLKWVTVKYDQDTKKFSGTLNSIDLPNLKHCNDYIGLSNVADADGFLMCSLTTEGESGLVQAWRLVNAGKGNISEVVRAEYQDITEEDAKGRFCPF